MTAIPALSAPIFLPFGLRSDRQQHEIVRLRAGRRLLALERNVERVLLRLDRNGLRLQHHAVEARLVHLFPDAEEIAVHALHQAVEHFDDVQARAERRIYGAHLRGR